MKTLKSMLAVFAVAMFMLPAKAANNMQAEANIVETAQSIGKFQTLLTAAQAAGLVDTLTSEGPFTVFAPNDRAFEQVPGAVINALLEDEELLRHVLLYHVVPGAAVYSYDLSNNMDVEMASESEAMIKLGPNGAAKINDAVILLTDVEASNGVIHVINKPILDEYAIQQLQAKGVL
ncbi:MAG: fasciclin domain-containing protein [Fimbriimonadaceae bacterium]